MGSRLSRQSSLEEEGAAGEEANGGKAEGGRGDFHLSSLLLHPQRLPGVLRKASPAPYVRRVGWLREIQATIREHKREHAVHILRLLRKVSAAGWAALGWPGRAVPSRAVPPPPGMLGQEQPGGGAAAGAPSPARRGGSAAPRGAALCATRRESPPLGNRGRERGCAAPRKRGPRAAAAPSLDGPPGESRRPPHCHRAPRPGRLAKSWLREQPRRRWGGCLGQPGLGGEGKGSVYQWELASVCRHSGTEKAACRQPGAKVMLSTEPRCWSRASSSTAQRYHRLPDKLGSPKLQATPSQIAAQTLNSISS